MTVAQCYEGLGGDYEATLKRLGSETLIKRLLVKFISDTSIKELFTAVESKDGSAAFRAAHTLKGLALNLGFNNLADSSSELTEKLRPCTLDADAGLLDRVQKDYQAVISAIKSLD